MSGFAGIIRFDGRLVEREEIANMTAAMRKRGPNGINHWLDGTVGLGHCMLRTTPESMEEVQPLANEDQSLVLVMDGRVDNWVDLRRELLDHGAKLRDHSDAELVLRAYEIWSEDCLDWIIGEFAFFVWDARRRSLFGARDPAGARHFYYHKGKDWFAFASEIKGLKTLTGVGHKLNESRVFDFLVERFDRDDEVGTFYEGIFRLPAGHAMRVADHGAETWRYWDPSDLEPTRFNSLDECAEAFREQLVVAVRCRLRCIGPVGADLSGGLDSSSIVGLICQEKRADLRDRLITFSLIRSDRSNCEDWKSLRHMVNNPAISPVIISSDLSVNVCRAFYEDVIAADEPFDAGYFTRYVVYAEACERGCRAILDGGAGDFLFYGFHRSINAVLNGKQLHLLPALVTAAWRHRRREAIGELIHALGVICAPNWAKGLYQRKRREAWAHASEQSILTESILEEFGEKKYLEQHRVSRTQGISDQGRHAQIFMSGTISFWHEACGLSALNFGIEPRSPYSDRRMLEFAIRMPVRMKLYAPWFKYGLRRSMVGILPEPLLWRRNPEGHPGGTFYKRLFEAGEELGYFRMGDVRLVPGLDRWINHDVLSKRAKDVGYSGHSIYRAVMLNRWLRARGIGAS